MVLTDADQKFLMNAFECLEEPMKVNYEKLASLTGVANPKSASNGFRSAMKKIKEGTTMSLTNKTTGSDSTPATPSPGRKRVRQPTGNADDEEDETTTPPTAHKDEQDGDDGGSPSKKARKPRAKKPPQLDEDGNVVIPKRVRKPKAVSGAEEGDAEDKSAKPKAVRKAKAITKAEDDGAKAIKEGNDAPNGAEFDTIDAVLEGAKAGKSKVRGTAAAKATNGDGVVMMADASAEPAEKAAITSPKA